MPRIKGYLQRTSVTTKVVVMFLVIMGLIVYRVSTTTSYYMVELQGQEDVNKSLKLAHHYLYEHSAQLDLRLKGLAKELNHLAVNSENLAHLSQDAQEWERKIRPDMFFYIDKQGTALYSANKKYLPEEIGAASRLFMSLQSVRAALAGRSSSGLEVIPAELLNKEGLTERSAIKVISTPKAKMPTYNVEQRALAVVSAQPVYSGGEIVGVLVAEQLLNNNNSLVDAIDQDLDIRATIFLDTIRVTTSVPNEKGERAIGTILSEEVSEQVLGRGKPYVGRAFVVNDWYITSYEPIRDLENKIIGSLYVGIKESMFLAKKRQLDNDIKMTLLFVSVVFVLAFYWIYRSIVSPVRMLSSWALNYATGKEEDFPGEKPNRCWKVRDCPNTHCKVYGKDHIRCWLVPETPCKEGACEPKPSICLHCLVYQQEAGNEIDQLGDAFHFMTGSIQEHAKSLNNLNIELEDKNCVLTDQRDELECQKEQLMALNEELEESMKALDDSQSIIYALAVAVEAKDPYTRGHSERVADFSVRLAKVLGIPGYELDIIRGAALLHDIGKIGISGTILRKPSTLTAMEFQQVRKHPTIGERICSSLKFAREMLPIIRHHHEHWDGRGYPDGLKGEHIPLQARIVAIADAFDAMTSDRPYRPGMTMEEAIKIIQGGSGSQWDPELVPLFVKLVVEDNEEIFEVYQAAEDGPSYLE